MASSYSGNPQTTSKDAVRFLISDTAAPFYYSDEEIVFVLETAANNYMAAALLSDKLAVLATSGGLSSKSVGSLSESYSQGSVQFYVEQANRYRTLGSGHQVPLSEEVPQKFSFRQFDAPGARGPNVREWGTVLSEEDE